MKPAKESRATAKVRKGLGIGMVSIGIAYVALSAILVFNQVKLSNTPFDEVGFPEGDQQGFAPVYLENDPSPEHSSAPTLSPDAQIASLNESAFSTQDQADIQLPPGRTSSDTASGSELRAPSGPIYAPDYISIPAIGLNAPVVPTASRKIEYEGRTYQQWVAPDAFEAGWQSDSAPLGEPGNTVLNGHHNAFGEVFRDLHNLRPGMRIFVYSGNKTFTYVVSIVMILKERDQPLEVRLENARWLMHSDDERLTLVTCWPYSSNTHRLIVVALPLDG